MIQNLLCNIIFNLSAKIEALIQRTNIKINIAKQSRRSDIFF